MKEREIKEFMKDTAVPEIVDRKCREAYDMIYEECEQKKKYKKISLKKGLAIGLCAAVVSGVFAVPVVAEHFSQNGFSFISKKTYTKDPMEKNDLTLYAKPVEKLAENSMADITLQSVYCDGTNLSVSLMLTPKNYELFKDTTCINGDLDITLDGRQLELIPERRIISFSGNSDDGNYYAVIHYENICADADKSPLCIKINGLQGVNGYKMIGTQIDEQNWDYEPEKTVAISDEYEFEYTVEADTSHNKVYEVNEAYGDITLKRIEVTPFMSTVCISGLDTDRQFLKMHDQNGDEFEGIYVEGDDKAGFSAPYKTTETLIVDICRLDMDGFPAEYSFEVPIDEGFADKYTVGYNDNTNFDQSKVVYDPPMDEISNAYNQEQQKIYDKMKAEVTPEPFGETIQTFDGVYKFNYTLKGIETAEISDYDVDDEDLRRAEKWWTDLDECKLMLLTFDIENPRNVEMDTTLYGITPTLISKNIVWNELDDACFLHEFAYVSEKDNYGKYSNLYTIGAHETRTFTVGYIVPEERIEAGYWLYCYPDYSGGNAVEMEMVLNGKAKLYETE
ncbi:MAG: DUF4179 domain-containing protein [Clostridium sp.]|nr:DUF4179 domain-containing protein [Clostridium sp.]MCM1547628.1 DUF4179 domain-containing protein [Ruminococcus sp.]